MSKNKVIALGSRLKNCKNVITLGVRPNFSAYSEIESNMIREANKIYYPAVFYSDIFNSIGKNTFPSYHTYKCVQDKIKQTAIFQLLNIPHPKTKVFYGKKQKEKILNFFEYPFIAKIAKGSAMGRGVYLIKNDDDLKNYLNQTTPAYIQEFLKIDRDIRIVIIGNKIVHSYWRISPGNDFRSNVSVGGKICCKSIPHEALDLAFYIANKCKWDDVGLDLCEYKGKYYVLEANMKYGKEGFRKAGIDYIKLMENMIEKGEI